MTLPRPLLVVLAALLLWGLAALSPSCGVASAAFSDPVLEVSFEPGASVRLRGGQFVTSARSDRAAINDVIARHDIVRIERVFRSSEASLDAARDRLLDEGRRDVPDLNRHFRIVAATAGERDRLISALSGLAVVDEVIRVPQPPPPPAGDYSAQQRYAQAAPVGINTGAIAGTNGGTGDRVKIIDVEYAWNAAHEDLGKAAGGLIPNGTPVDPFDSTDHGTAVLGELIATPNGFGATGLAPGSAIGMVNAANPSGYALPEAVNIARLNLSPGDVMLLEQQFPVTPDGTDYVASEYWPAVYDAIKLATEGGIIVVEAGGNGGVNLDSLQQPFPAGKADSGAIIVGAGSGDCGGPPNNARLSESAYGGRVNLQGWGQCVTTTGYGSLFNGGPNALYTSGFAGTSSASPIVAAAAALFSSVFQAVAGGRAPHPLAVRNRLISTGTAQAASPAGQVGPLPNILAAATGFDFTPPTVAIGDGPPALTNDATPTFSFTPSEAGSTLHCRVVGVTAFAPCSSPFTAAALGDGAHAFEVKATDAALNPGDATARTFTVDTTAPTVSVTAGPAGLTNDATPTFSFTVSEAGSIECRIAGVTAYGACASPFTAPALADGAATFEVKATDAALNPGTPTARAFTIDTVAPTASITAGPTDSTQDPTPTFSFTADEPGTTFACRAGTPLVPGAFAACASPYTTATLADGASAFEVQPTDPAGNTGPVASRAFTVAAPPPPPPPPPGVKPPTIGPSARLTVKVAGGGIVQLRLPKISCPTPRPSCVVTATARLASGRKPRIGAVTFRIAPGTSARVRLRLTAAYRARLRRRGQLKATVAITARHDSQVKRRSVQLTLKRKR